MDTKKKEIKILTIKGLLELSPEEQLAWVAEVVPSVPPEDRKTYFDNYLKTQQGDLDNFGTLEDLKKLMKLRAWYQWSAPDLSGLSRAGRLVWVEEYAPTVEPEEREEFFGEYLEKGINGLNHLRGPNNYNKFFYKKNKAPKKIRWLSIQKPWKQVHMFGVFLGISDDTFFQPVGFGLGRYLITVGPHTTSGSDKTYKFPR